MRRSRLTFRPAAKQPPGNGAPIRALGDGLGAGPYDNAAIADVGLRLVGTRTRGQCKQAVNDWVAAASGGHQHLGGGYFSDYRREGGMEVGRDDAVKGDVIQLNKRGHEDVYFYGMHTAVVVGHQRGSNAFDVVDSNYSATNDQIVRHHAFDPYAQAGRYGLVVHIWRMGTVPAAAPPAPSGPPSAHLTAPAAGATASGVVHVAADLANAVGVAFSAYYATSPADVGTVGWHAIGSDLDGRDGWGVDWDTRGIPDQGNAGWGTVNLAAVPILGGGVLSGDGRDYRRIAVANGGAGAPAPPPPAPVYVHHVTGTCRDGACGLKVRSGPGYSAYGVLRTIAEGGEADVACQAMGQTVSNGYASSAVWDRLTDGGWVSDFYLDTPNIGTWSPPIPQC